MYRWYCTHAVHPNVWIIAPRTVEEQATAMTALLKEGWTIHPTY